MISASKRGVFGVKAEPQLSPHSGVKRTGEILEWKDDIMSSFETEIQKNKKVTYHLNNPLNKSVSQTTLDRIGDCWQGKR